MTSTAQTSDPTARERLEIIQRSRSVALVGVSANPIRSSNFVAAYLVRTSLRAYLVNPAYDEVLGERCYPSLAHLPEAPDIVDVFRRPDAIPGVVDEAIAVNAKVVWFQLGLRHDKAAYTAREAGLAVVQDRCLKIEHARWHGGLHYAGFDSGVITSKRYRPL